MIITQILNNNVISVTNSLGNELILTGRGLGFSSRVGDVVDLKKVEKTFFLRDKNIFDRFKTLVMEVPIDILELTSDIIEMFKESSSDKLSDGLYVTLSDHLNHAILRDKKGDVFYNPLIWEVKQFYPDEYNLGERAILVINARTGVLLSDSEACSIALHVISAKLNDDIHYTNEITKLIYQVQNIVKIYFNINYRDDDVNYQRFINHLKFFSKRIIDGIHLENDDCMFREISKRHQRIFDCVDVVDAYIYNNYSHKMSDSEKLYLSAHISNMISSIKCSV